MTKKEKMMSIKHLWYDDETIQAYIEISDDITIADIIKNHYNALTTLIKEFAMKGTSNYLYHDYNRDHPFEKLEEENFDFIKWWYNRYIVQRI